MIGIISDIHGNYPALCAVLRALEQIRCNKILCLGDVAGYYCMVNECICELKERGITNLLGNHDYYLIKGSECKRSLTVNECIRYQRKIINNDNLKWLEKSLLTYDDTVFSARHGGWNDPTDEYVREFDFSKARTCKARIFISGHTHIQMIQDNGEIVYFNPGSVGQPRDHDCRAAFAVLDDNYKVHLYREDYDIEHIVYEMRHAGFDNYVTEGLFTGTRIGGDV